MKVLQDKGLSFQESLDITKCNVNKDFCRILDYIEQQILAGINLSEIFKTLKMPRLFCSFTQHGENTSNIQLIWGGYLKITEEKKQFLKVLKQNLSYPIFLFFLTIALIVANNVFLYPTVQPLIKEYGSENTIGIMFLTYFPVFIVGCFFCLFIFPAITYRRINQQKPLSQSMLSILSKVPFVALILKIQQWHWLNQFNVCQNAGFSFKEMMNSDNRMNCINQKKLVATGVANEIARIFYLNIFYTKLLKVGESSGRLQVFVEIILLEIKQEIDNDLKLIQQWVGPILTLIIGLIMITLAVTVITPIYDSIGTIN